MSKKYKDHYEYQNSQPICPSCGAILQQKDKDCPFCGINLVGLNAKSNMASNMSEYATTMQNLSQRNDALNRQIQRDNAKMKNNRQGQKTKNNKAIKGILIAISTLVIFIIVIGAILANNPSYGKITQGRTYRELAHYFDKWNGETDRIDEIDHDFNPTKSDSYTRNDLITEYEMSYDKSNGLSVLKETYQTETENFSVYRFIPKTVAHIPDVNISTGSFRYSGKSYYMSISDEFYESNDVVVQDTYIIQEVAESDDMNYIEKYKILKIDDTEIHVYLSENETYYAYSIIGIVQLSDTCLYVTTVSFEEHSDINLEYVLENIDQYLYIEKE